MVAPYRLVPWVQGRSRPSKQRPPARRCRGTTYGLRFVIPSVLHSRPASAMSVLGSGSEATALGCRSPAAAKRQAVTRLVTAGHLLEWLSRRHGQWRCGYLLDDIATSCYVERPENGWNPCAQWLAERVRAVGGERGDHFGHRPRSCCSRDRPPSGIKDPGLRGCAFSRGGSRGLGIASNSALPRPASHATACFSSAQNPRRLGARPK